MNTQSMVHTDATKIYWGQPSIINWEAYIESLNNLSIIESLNNLQSICHNKTLFF
jgi:hypothetical protein